MMGLLVFSWLGTVLVGLGLLISGHNARYRLPDDLRGHTGLARIPIGILMMTVPIAWAGIELSNALDALASV